MPQEISATEPDWTREQPRGFWDPSRKLLKSIREYQSAGSGPLDRLRRKLAVVRHRFWSIVSGADIPLNCRIGGGLQMPHPNGVVIHPGASVGVNCLLLQQVTLVNGVTLGGNVDIGAGAKIIRPVTIGDYARIGANAVVLENIPAGAVAVGIPAQVARTSTLSDRRESSGPIPGESPTDRAATLAE
ncbi:serine O-acetyltransferase [Microbulbifer sp. YPW16]|uniref:serine O-acetyltransferase n=1 Tax=unclassified Microbulbifer TaxID=2619833 RepID=UPI001E4CBB21|nr:hypothetical protein [Microbulbifer sp. YPW16]UHQ55568.1 hypothetical protein LVE68_00845 [Microbulbifer sp. YPW16]